jgi:predicted nucleic acid-binding protein
MGFVLDTNLYIGALRDPARSRDLHSFLDVHLPRTHLHSVVVQELVAGATTDAAYRRLAKVYIEPFERRGRIVVPDYASWKRSGEIISALVRKKLISPGTFKKSFLAHVLLAASCRQFGHTLVTANVSDFELIRRVERVEFTAPYPPH